MSVNSASLRSTKLDSISRAYLEFSAFNHRGNDDTTPPGNFEYFLDSEEKRHRNGYSAYHSRSIDDKSLYRSLTCKKANGRRTIAITPVMRI